MDIRKVKKLIELMEASDINEIEIKEGEESVRISRNSVLQVPQGVPGDAVSNHADGGKASAPSFRTAPKVKGDLIHAPMVGTFYAAPSPGSPPFVEIGRRIEVGDTLCIIESMKMMNQVKSEVSGVIEAVLVGNEDTVEFDQPLFTIA